MYSPWRWAEAKKIAEETSPKVFSPVARGVIAQTKSVFVPTLSVAVPNSWAVRERSVHHHTRHLSQAWRGTPRVHQRPLASIIPVCGSREVMKRIVQLWSVHRRTQGTYQVKPTCSYWVWLQKQECTIFTTCCITVSEVSQSLKLMFISSTCIQTHCEGFLLQSSASIMSKNHLQSCSKNINEHCFQVATFAKVELLACYSQTHHIPYIPQKWVCVEPSQPFKCTSEKMI